jgi:hypothetical protein
MKTETIIHILATIRGSRIDLINVSELERRAKLTRNRISDVQRYRAKLTAEEFERVYDVLRTILPPE